MRLFVPNPDLQKDLEGEDDYQSGLARVGEEIRDTAKALAPVESGAYRDSIQVVTQDGRIYVVVTDFKGHLIEWGTVDTPAFGVMRRAVLQNGLRLAERQR